MVRLARPITTSRGALCRQVVSSMVSGSCTCVHTAYTIHQQPIHILRRNVVTRTDSNSTIFRCRPGSPGQNQLQQEICIDKANSSRLKESQATLDASQYEHGLKATLEPDLKHDLQNNQSKKHRVSNAHSHTPSGYSVSFKKEALLKHQDMVKQCWPTASSELCQKFPEFAYKYQCIKHHNQLNCVMARCNVQSALHPDQWESVLQYYHDREICMYIRYGWPVGFSGNTPPISVPENHQSATAHPQHVRKFITTELAHGAIIGPIREPPLKPWV